VALGRLHGVSAAALAEPAVVVPADASLAETDRFVLARRPSGAGPIPHVVALGADRKPAGVLDPAAANAVPADRRAGTPLTAVLHRLPADAVLDAGLVEEALLRAVAAGRQPRYVVVGPDGRLVGVLRTAALERLLTG
jgi:hypothetical protein